MRIFVVLGIVVCVLFVLLVFYLLYRVIIGDSKTNKSDKKQMISNAPIDSYSVYKTPEYVSVFSDKSKTVKQKKK